MAETWLPEEPSPPIKPASRARRSLRTLLIWVVLVILFAGIYARYEPSQRGMHARDTSSVPWGWLVAGGVVIVVGLFLWQFGGWRRFNARQKPGLDAMSNGHYARAAQLFGDLAREYRARPTLMLMATFNQAVASIRTGDSAAAVGLLLRIERSPLPQLAALRGVVALELARAFAIGGDVEKAERWLDAARTRPRRDLADQRDATIAATEGMIRCRAGRFQDAARHYDDSWQQLQATLSVRNMQEVWLLRAFAARKTSSPRDAAAAEPWLRLLRGTESGTFAWLTRHWPELEMFVDHELGSASAPVVAPPHGLGAVSGT